MIQGKGLSGPLKTTLVLSAVVAIMVPAFMNSERAMEWKELAMFGVLSFASFWALTFAGLILTALIMRRSKQKRN